MIKLGVKNTGADTKSLIHKNTEEVQNELDAKAQKEGGTANGINVPIPVPVS